METWLDYIESELSNIDFDSIETKETEHYLSKMYRKDGTYIHFELVDEQRKIRKLEVGKYWPTDKNVWGYEVSDVKGMLDIKKPALIDFLQCSFDGEYGTQYELKFSEQSKKVLMQFLSIPLECGWTESYFKFNDDYYKTHIDLKVGDELIQYKIVLLHFAEQDLPLPGDKAEKRLRAWWAGLKRNDSRRLVKNEIVKPIKNVINKL